MSGAVWRPRLLAAGLAGPLVDRLSVFLELLERWQAVTNLVGRVSDDELVRDHLIESLAGASLLPAAGRMLDIGSGNGFPAVPLLVARPQLTGVLLEPRERRWAFLREAVRELGVAADVRRERLEQHRGAGYAVLTARAVAADVWSEDALRVLAPGGVVLWWSTVVSDHMGALERVVTSPLPDPRRGSITVWRPCST